MITKHRSSRAQVTLGRALSKLGVSSRSQAARILESGRVSVNGEVVKDADVWLDLRTDKIALDGIAARPREKRYLVMHKPAGVVTTRSDERGRKTVYDLLPPMHVGCHPVGRLDRETSGLLFFTNDTAFGEFITNPSKKIPKTYRVLLEAPMGDHDSERLERGMTLENGTRYLPARVQRSDGKNAYLITIVEGKNREIRRMMKEFGCTVKTLTRVEIGSVALGDLQEGSVRNLTERELSVLGWLR